MKEYIGPCCQCGTALHCEDGFFNGVVLSQGVVICFDCQGKENKKR